MGTTTVKPTANDDPLAEPSQPTPEATDASSKKPSRPEDLSEWKKADFLSAKRENDPHLVEAVQRLGMRRAGDASIVEILVALLTETPVEKPADQADSNTPPGSLQPMGLHAQGAPLEQAQAAPNPQMILAAVGALALNNTNEARGALRQIVSGQLRTDDDQTATPSAMRVLLRQPTPEGDALMLQALVEPQKLRKESGEPAEGVGGMGRPSHGIMGYGGNTGVPLSAEDLQAKAKELVNVLASESFRVKLAEHLLGGKATVKQREDLVPMLSTPHPDNVAAQLLIYQAPVPAKKLKNDFEKYFAEISSVALGHVLRAVADKESEPEETETPGIPAGESKESDGGWGGIKAGGDGLDEGGIPLGPSGGSIGLGPGDPLSEGQRKVNLDNPKVIYPLAKKLWNAKTAQAVIVRGDTSPASEAANHSFLLARTMPVDSVRAALFRLLSARFKEGPGQIFGNAGSEGGLPSSGIGLMGSPYAGDPLGASDGQTPKAFLDPGMLIVVKSLPLPVEKPPRSTTPKRGSSPQAQPSGAEALGVSGGNGVEPKTPEEQWLEASKNLVLALCQQCRAAAKTPTEEDSKIMSKSPIRIPRGAKPIVCYYLKWPDDASEKLGDFKLDPIEIYYTRIEEEAQYSRVEKYYRGKLGRPQQHVIGDKVAWIETLKEGSTPGTRLSRDVLITRSQSFAPLGDDLGTPRGRQREPAEQLVIETFTVETKNPAGAGDTEDHNESG